ncbi:hypothetical protein RND81_07G051600 [Saponaria officinalis]|uniref:Protein EFFECTOR OF TRANSCRIPTION 2-like n=1 Tax=Saponaria officinalis TaxID=3572 RepID=A0AAW1JKL7_SAPOF
MLTATQNLTTTTTTTTITRLKREEFRRTKHDTAFSKWRVLIGPSDWADYEAQKEGAERYRVANLPDLNGPGVYEIGVAVYATSLGRNVEKLETERVVVVYLGQADNVRCRLQHYGRCGSHLVYGVDLFQQVFDRGFPIVYRWALMKSKSEAERTEVQLLEKFDYAWNKLGNGSRRPDDVLKKIDMISSKTHNVPKICKMLQALRDQKVGIPIKAEKLSLDNKPNHDTYDGENLGLLGRVFKFSRSRPCSVSPDPGTIVKDDLNQTVICGVTASDGSICNKPPVEGRKRCTEHRGMKLTCKSLKKESTINDSDRENIICGVTQHDGSHCELPPLPGRKRCTKHKGMRVNQAMSEVSNPISLITVSLSNPVIVDICGVHLDDGNCCTRKPVKGRKRCDEHKGMRVDVYVSKLSSRDKWFNAKLA